MAITVTVEELAEAMRLGSSAREAAQVTRLLQFASDSIVQFLGQTQYDMAPDSILNEAVVRIAGYLYDVPTVNKMPPNFMRLSGAERILSPHKKYRAL